MRRAVPIPLSSTALADQVQPLFAGFEARFTAAPAETAFHVAGTDFLCRSADASYSEILVRVLPVAVPSAAPQVRVLVDLCDTPLSLGWPRWSEPYFREREVEAALFATPFRLHFHDQTDFWQVFDRGLNCGLQLMRKAAGYPDWDTGSPLRNLIHWALAEQGGGLVHAGSLGLGERAVLLAGTGGSGKSGTVLAGLLHGLTSLGDDYVAITTKSGIRAHRAFNSLKQDPGGFARLGLTGRVRGKAALNWQGKHQFTFDHLGVPSQPDSLPVTALCLPHVATAARTTFAPVSAREAFLALAPSGVAQIPSARAETFRLCAALSRDLPAYRVALGTDPAEIAAAFAAFLDGTAP
ncbi:hypothetical protein [Fuscibacter oryzae]|uniref:Serine kinase n=1 Tax=Fuscibacter oryzae TaxID=2803939 RepID=A0A8J7MPZ3_9RHOB|nr:hypothetical protein [Fuscibacter oryzae]MBL4929010.1 hypothetical protein [Fuscibacter oryzae]